jgi:hypothetical protein
MTAQNPAVFLQAGSHPAEDVRRFIGGAVPFPGVVGTADLAVTEKSGTANMSVDVAGGRAFIAGSEATYQGTYFVENRGTTNLVISAADATNPRIDLIVAKVQDSGYSGATDAWSLAVVTGTPAASPSAPTAPDNSLVLARVAVAANATSIVNANITDYRYITSGQSIATAAGGTVICRSNNRPASPWQGLEIYETDTNLRLVYNGSAWVCITPVTARVEPDQATTSTSFTDLTTVGPSVSIQTGTKALVHFGAQIYQLVGGAGTVSFAVSGATTRAAVAAEGVAQSSTATGIAASTVIEVTGLTAGVNVFTLKYLTSSNTLQASRRFITVVGLP